VWKAVRNVLGARNTFPAGGRYKKICALLIPGRSDLEGAANWDQPECTAKGCSSKHGAWRGSMLSLPLCLWAQHMLHPRSLRRSPCARPPLRDPCQRRTRLGTRRCFACVAERSAIPRYVSVAFRLPMPCVRVCLSHLCALQSLRRLAYFCVLRASHALPMTGRAAVSTVCRLLGGR